MKPLSLLLSLLLWALPSAAAPSVRIVSPPPNQPLFGEVEIRAEVIGVGGAAVSRVEFYLDSLRIGVAEAPPWRIVVDVGQQNADHSVEVVAYGPSGVIGSASLRALPLQIDDEIEVGLQQLYVVIDRGGQRANDLKREDFTILDDGVPHEIITFERGEIPFTAVLLVDSSTSMSGSRLRTAVDGAKTFVGGMKRLDEAKMILFSDRILLETPFTSIQPVLTLGLRGVAAEGGTALNDALFLAAKRLETRRGRKIAVLLSDGVDVESVLSVEEARAIARRQVSLYWLRLPRKDVDKKILVNSAWRDAPDHQREIDLLRGAVLGSGGRIVDLTGVEEIPAQLTTLLRELRDQYVLGITPSRTGGRGSWHEVRLEVRGGLQPRTQDGYFEP